MNSVLNLFNDIVNLYIWVLVINVILSWLIAFNVLNTYNRFVGMILYATQRLTNPLLNPIRRFLPNLGGLDISPIVLILLLFFIQDSLRIYLLGL